MSEYTLVLYLETDVRCLARPAESRVLMRIVRKTQAADAVSVASSVLIVALLGGLMVAAGRTVPYGGSGSASSPSP